ncbi:MAG: glucans biosynthesis glucosyltransferase MdoH [Hyphomicrobiaceae bacterium]
MNSTGQMRAPDTGSRHTVSVHPLLMPPQELTNYRPAMRQLKPAAGPQSVCGRIILAAVLAATLIATSIFSTGLYQALALQNGGTLAHYLFLGVATLLFAWIAFGAANALAGAAAILTGRGSDTIKLPPATTPLTTRTALLFPIYHEDPGRIVETILDLDRELRKLDVVHHFDVFILSDSQRQSARSIEAATFADFAHDYDLRLRVTYRNREKNVAKKAGNIADWVRRFGGGYDHFVIFDADSMMSGELLASLAAAMERTHDSAVIQTVPRLIRPATRFAALNAFANNVYGPTFAAGFALWQGGSGNYWGHNAIIRTRAFAACAGLPVLPGKAPFGGHILSHDFVEAALLRRAGWRIDLVTSASRTFEEGPPTLIDMAIRDRRWMQGNIQHLSILAARGLAPISRVHLTFGILAYASSALWATLIGLGLWLSWHEKYRATSYFSDAKSLFPAWPTFDTEAGLRVLAGTLAVLLLPKIVGLAVQLWRHRGPLTQKLQMVGVALAETAASTLVAPVLMAVHVRGLCEILFGRDSGWSVQTREGRSLSLSQAVSFHTMHVAAGIFLAATASAISIHTALWLLPVIIGLVSSPLLTWFTSKCPNRSRSFERQALQAIVVPPPSR